MKPSIPYRPDYSYGGSQPRRTVKSEYTVGGKVIVTGRNIFNRNNEIWKVHKIT